MRRVRSLLASRFSASQLLDTKAPDEVIALGAAVQASLLCVGDGAALREVSRHPSVPALSRGIYVKVAAAGAPLVKVLAQGTTVPAKWQQAVARGDTGQTGICLEVFERGDDQDDSQATLLARVSMTELEAESALVASVSVRSDGSVHVSCSDKRKNRTESVTLEPVVALEQHAGS